jgi:hypothetical protein
MAYQWVQKHPYSHPRQKLNIHKTAILTVVSRKRETWFSILRLRVSEDEKWEAYVKNFTLCRVFKCYSYVDEVKLDEQ